MARSAASLRQVVRTFGTCLDFTTSDRVTFSGPAFGTAGSFVFWVNRETAAVDRYIFDSTNGNRYLFYRNNTGAWEFFLNSVLIANPALSLITANQWTFVVLTWDNSLSSNKQAYYKNGVLFSNSNTTISTSATPTNFYLNQKFDGTQRSVQRLDDFAIYSRALTASEVSTMYYTSTYPTSGLLHRWRMNEGSGTSLTDSAGSLTGTITGATYSSSVFMSTLRSTATERQPATYSTPDDISGLTLWLDANQITGLNNNDSVATWSDASGNGNNATQGTGSAQPTYKTNQLNGCPTVSFDGSDDLTVANEANFDLTTYTIFIVASRSGGAALFSKNVLIANSTRRKLQVVLGTNTFVYNAGGDGSTTSYVGTVTTASFNIYGVVGRANNDHDLIVNGTVENKTTVLDDTSFNNGSPQVGGAFSNGAERITGDVAEIIIYGRALTVNERRRIERYLSDKYAITIANALARVAA